LPRRRELGPLTLDLIHRDARADGTWLSLHPREFGLLWRLAERPGELVSRARLLRDVWRLDFEPGTNSVEVHVSRLRAKLARAGLAGLVETDPQGGYRLGAPPAPAHDRTTTRPDLRLCA
jgi:two-component system OmpR family response regulator